VSSEFAGILPSGFRLHEYEVLRVLGRPGGFGITYLANDTHLAKEVAIKEFLPPELAVRGDGSTVTVRSRDDRPAFDWGLKSFLNEARVLARFHHPNVVQVHRFFEANATAYIVMEYVRGETLSELFQREGKLDEARIKAILLPIIDGLDTVHKAGVLHRDVKPENILIRENGAPTLIDFGAARNSIGGKSKSILSVLTAGYAPIEQYSETGTQGPYTDIYALGAVAYRAISGQRPVDAISRIGEDPLVPAIRVGAGRYSEGFLHAIDRALRVNQSARPQNLSEWRDELGKTVAPRRQDAMETLVVDVAALEARLQSHASTSPPSTTSLPEAISTPAPTPAPPPPPPPRAASPAPRRIAPTITASEPDPTTPEQPVVSPAPNETSSTPLLLISGIAALLALAGAGAWYFLQPSQPAVPGDAAPSLPVVSTPRSIAPEPPVQTPLEPAIKAPIEPPVEKPIEPPPPTIAENKAPPIEAQTAPDVLPPTQLAVEPPAPAAAPPIVESKPVPVIDPETQDWEQIRKSKDVDAFRDYLTRWPKGRHAKEAGAAIKRLTPAPIAAPPPVVEAPKPAPEPEPEPIVEAGPGPMPKIAEKLDGHKAGQRFRDCRACPEMVVIPGGRFTMGSSAEDAVVFPDEAPAHIVTIAYPLAVSRTETTFDQWEACQQDGGCPGGMPDDGGAGRGDRPVINVSWNEAAAYASWLSRKSGKKYRLPTEAEWEYAARAQTETVRYWGNRADQQCRNANGPDQAARERYVNIVAASCNDSYVETAPVGKFAPNAYGLFDMLGNVWEWTADCYHPDYEGAPTDGTAWDGQGCSRVVRGGAWDGSPDELRSAERLRDTPGARRSNVGFRVVRSKEDR
jgi:formylglycine-generating enzyme required for sulfatase activity/serine/threonine protein kinase